MTVLLLVVIIGRPLETYLQSLILIAMLAFELQYEAIRRHIRFPVVWRLQLATMSILFLSLLVSMFTLDAQNTASARGLRALGIVAIAGNIALCATFVWYIVHGYKDKAIKWLRFGSRRMSCSAKGSRSKQFLASARRQPSGDPMLTSGMTSPGASSVEMSRAPSGYATGSLRRSSSILTSQEIAAIWTGPNNAAAQGN